MSELKRWFSKLCSVQDRCKSKPRTRSYKSDALAVKLEQIKRAQEHEKREAQEDRR
jgi:hypothetical protein